MAEAVFKRCPGYAGDSYRQVPHDLPDDPQHFYSHKKQCRTCYLAYAAEWRATRAAKGITPVPRITGGPKAKLVLDGITQLTEVLALAGYTVIEAVAKYTVFLDPVTVAQTAGRALFPIIRDIAMENRGTIVTDFDGQLVLRDDNTSATNAFLWSGQLRKGPDVQFNHVWNDSRNRDAYTALWNLCATPAFLAKTTDGANHPEVVAALRFHAWALYGTLPGSASIPAKPPGYERLVWAPYPAAVTGLEAVLRARLRANPKSRAAKACREIGWLFSDWKPDRAL